MPGLLCFLSPVGARFPRLAAALLFLALCCAGIAQAPPPANWSYQPIYPAYCSAYSPDGRYLAIGGTGGVQLFYSATRTYIRTFPTSATLVESVAFSPDGKTLATGGGNLFFTLGVLETWSVATGKLIQEIDTPSGDISAVAFSPDGTKVAEGGTYGASIYGTRSGLVACWDPITGQLLEQFNTSAWQVRTIAFSPDGATLAVGGFDAFGVVELWNVASKSRLVMLPTANTLVNNLAFAPNGKSLAAGGWKPGKNLVPVGNLEIWDPIKFSLKSTLTTTSNEVYCAQYSPDGKTLAVGISPPTAEAREVLLVSASTGSILGGLTPTVHSNAVALSYSRDSKQLLVCSTFVGGTGSNFAITVWNPATAKPIGTIDTIQYVSAGPISLSPSGKTVVIGGSQPVSANDSFAGYLSVLDAGTGALVKSLPTAGFPRSVAYSPDGTLIASAGMTGASPSKPVCEVWNSSSGKLIRTLATAATNQISQICFSPDGAKIATCGLSNTADSKGSFGVIELWDSTTGKVIRELPTLALGGVAAVAFSPDGQTLIDIGDAQAPSSYQAGLVEVWDVSTGTALPAPYTGLLYPLSVAFSPDGSTVAVGGQKYVQTSNSLIGGVELFNLDSISRIGWLPVDGSEETVTALQFSPDGQLLYAATNPMLQIFNVASLSSIKGFSLGGVGGLSLSADASLLAYTTYEWQSAVAPNPAAGPIPISAISLNFKSVESGATPSATVSLAQAAPKGGVIVPVFSNSTLAQVPLSITVPTGSKQASFYIQTGLASQNTSVTISAGYGLARKAATLTITPPVIDSVVLNPYTVKGGASSTITIVLDAYAPVGGVTLALSSSSSVVSVPAKATVPAGKGSVTATVTTSKVSKKTSVTLTVKVGGSVKTVALTVT